MKNTEIVFIKIVMFTKKRKDEYMKVIHYLYINEEDCRSVVGLPNLLFTYMNTLIKWNDNIQRFIFQSIVN